jgi:P4 family phage/plasmid primase-like protien
MYKDDKNPNNIRYKNGFHLHFPNCFIERDTIKEYIIPAVKQLVKEKNVFSELSHLKVEDIIDDAVIRNPWLMYGSRKSPTSQPYRLTRIYNGSLEECGFEALNKCEIYNSKSELIEFTKDISFYLPYILSIHPNFRKIYKIKDDIITYKVVTPVKDFKKSSKVSKSVKEDLIEANKLIKLLKSWRAENYAEWIQIGWILYNVSQGSEEGFELWCKFSEKCPEKFDRDYCLDQWENRFSIRNYTIASLHYYAKHDNETAYNDMIKEKEVESLETILKYKSHNDIAKLLHLKVGSTFVCCSIKKNIWYRFTNHRWKLIEEGHSLREMISTEVTTGLRGLLGQLTNDISADTAANIALKQKTDAIYKMIQNTGNASFKDGVLKEAREIFYNPKFRQRIDNNPNLIAFKNGIYDLENNIFREGSPDDCITMKMNIKYKEYNKDDDVVQQLEKFLEQIFPDKSVRKYFLDIYSEIFIGNNAAKKFLVWSGEGNNGKSVTEKLFINMLGPYSVVLPTSLITGKRGSSAGASPELARTEGVRVCWLQEPSPDERINPGILKELTGNDKFYARGLYQEGNDINAMFKLVLVCNTPPKLESDQASWNRVRILPFESTFCDDAPESYEEQLRQKKFKIDYDFEEEKLPHLLEAFAWYLIEYRKNKPKNFKLYEPEKVKMATSHYRNRNDIYKLFISEQIDNVSGAILELTDLYDMFKEWFKESMPGQKPPAKNALRDEFTKIWGPPDDNICWRGFKQKPPRIRIENEEEYELVQE